MHTLFVLSALVLAAALGGVGALLLFRLPVGGRQPLALAVLAAPPFVLALAAFHLILRFWGVCDPLGQWDHLVSLGLLLALGGITVGALGMNLARLALVERLLMVCPPLVDEALTARVAVLAQRLGITPPAVRMLEAEAPLAVTGGLRRPTIVLSRWLLEQLDHREVEAVLAHELAHLARRHYLTRWLGRLLRDATAYLPGSWYTLRVLEADEELAADALAVAATRRPLAMASALGKVWQQAMMAPSPVGLAGLPGYAGASAALLEERLGRLLDGRVYRKPTRAGPVLAGASVLSVGYLTPRLLAAGASALPLVCSPRLF